LIADDIHISVVGLISIDADVAIVIQAISTTIMIIIAVKGKAERYGK
jgi:hypothetical protein